MLFQMEDINFIDAVRTTNNLFFHFSEEHTHKKHKARNALFLHLSLYLNMLIYSFNKNALSPY